MTKYRFPCNCEFDILSRPKGYEQPLLDFSYDKINLDCPAVWQQLQSGINLGIFQLESNLGIKYTKELKPENIEHLSALTAILRPAALQAFDENGKNLASKYCDRKNNREPTKAEFPTIEHILRDTYSLLIFQEQAILIGQEVCGFTPSEADSTIRKGLGKKDTKLLFSIEEKFIQGANKVGKITPVEAKKLFDWIKAGARYSFNKCLHGDTEVITRLGRKKLINVNIGDEVLAPTSNHYWDTTWAKVLEFHDNKEQDLVNVIFDTGQSIKCTLNHKFRCGNDIIAPLYEILIRGHSILSKGYKWPEIKAIIPIGKHRTYDITVNTKDHIYIANDLLVSNSHSTLYGIRAACDAYLKSHFALQFYTAKLKSPRKSTTSEDIANIIYEMRTLGIDAKLPDIRHMRPLFYNDGKSIYFGLSGIKGYGESAFSKLAEVFLANSEEGSGTRLKCNFFEFAINSALRLSESSTCLLIEAGALDWTGLTRSQMLEEFRLVAQLTDGEKDKLGKYLAAQKAGVFNDNQ